MPEINLLPKKEQRSYTMMIVAIVLTALFIGAGAFLYFTYNGYKKHLEQLNNNLAVTKELIAYEQANAEVVEQTNSALQLKDLVAWSESYVIKTVPVLNELTALLPERGFFLNYIYTSRETIQISVQFDTLAESSSYLDQLLSSEWTSDAKLSTIAAEASFSEIELDGRESDTAADNSRQMVNDDYVPRYQANYEVKLNIEYINEMRNEENGKQVADTSSSSEGDNQDD